MGRLDSTVSLWNHQVKSNWGETYEFCLKADRAAALGTTKLRNIANGDADVAEAGVLISAACFRQRNLTGRKFRLSRDINRDPCLTDHLRQKVNELFAAQD